MFRIATSEDLESLAQIYKQTVQQLATKLYTPQQVKAWSEASDNREKFTNFIFEPTTYLYVENCEILGFCGLKKDGHIVSLYVAHQHTRKGVGTKLIKNALREGEKLNLHRFYTEASYLSKVVFERCGFQVYDQEYVNYAEVEFHRYKMEKLC